MNDKNNIKNKALKLLDGAYDLETPEDNIVYYLLNHMHYLLS